MALTGAARVWSGIRDMLRLQSSVAQNVDVPAIILPVLDVGSFLGAAASVSVSLNLDIAANTFVSTDALKVPKGKRWTVEKVSRYTSSSTTAILLARADSGTSVFLGVNGTAALTIDGPITMEEGDQLGMSATDDVNDAAATITAHYVQYDIPRG